jgi:hypothetical protein
MEDKICILLPTKQRLNDFVNCVNSWKKTTEGKSQIVAIIDDDDSTYDNLIQSDVYPIIYERVTPKPFLLSLNQMAVKYTNMYNYIAFAEDDILFKTLWETPIIEKLKELGKAGIVWANDLLNQDRLVGIPFFNSSFVSTLSYIAPPKFKTQVCDAYWLELGKKCNSLYYFDDIIIEHLHYITGKRAYDSTSAGVDAFIYSDREYHESEEYKQLVLEDAKKLLT